MKKSLQTLTLVAVVLSALMLSSSCGDKPKVELPNLYYVGKDTTITDTVETANNVTKTFIDCNLKRKKFTDLELGPDSTIKHLVTKQGRPFNMDSFAKAHPGAEIVLPNKDNGSTSDTGTTIGTPETDSSSFGDDLWKGLWEVLKIVGLFALIVLIIWLPYRVLRNCHHADRIKTVNQQNEYLAGLNRKKSLENDLTKAPVLPAVVAVSPAPAPLPDNKDKVESVPQTENKQTVVTEKVTTPNVPVLIEEVTVTEKIERTTVTKKYL